VPGYAELASVNGPRISPFGTPSCANESGPRRYRLSGSNTVGVLCAAGNAPRNASIIVEAARARTGEIIVRKRGEVKVVGAEKNRQKGCG
jgi:hypothetical protein